MVFLIFDGHPAHKAKSVKRYAEAVKDRSRLFFLPPYSPELNPDERVRNDLKNNAVGRHISHLQLVQESPDRVRSYFQSKTTRYAA